MPEIECPYCGRVIAEVSQETFESDEAYQEILADHRARNAICEQRYREYREARHGY